MAEAPAKSRGDPDLDKDGAPPDIAILQHTLRNLFPQSSGSQADSRTVARTSQSTGGLKTTHLMMSKRALSLISMHESPLRTVTIAEPHLATITEGVARRSLPLTQRTPCRRCDDFVPCHLTCLSVRGTRSAWLGVREKDRGSLPGLGK